MQKISPSSSPVNVPGAFHGQQVVLCLELLTILILTAAGVETTGHAGKISSLGAVIKNIYTLPVTGWGSEAVLQNCKPSMGWGKGAEDCDATPLPLMY